jgi:hypothetical protein
VGTASCDRRRELDGRTWAILELERSWSRRDGDGSPGGATKERTIRERLGMSSTRYHQLLMRAIDLPEALAFDPMLVHRLVRLREARRRARLAGRLGLPI